MKKSVVGLVISLLLVTSGASAAVVSYAATLNGGQVVPPVSSPGSGTATLQFDTGTKMLTGTVTFSGISVERQTIGGAGPCGASPATLVEALPAPVGNTITLAPVGLSTLYEGLLIGGALSITLKSTAGDIRGQIYEVGSGKSCGGAAPDAGTVDASAPDSSAPDSGAPDSSAPDSGAPADAGRPVDAASAPSPAPTTPAESAADTGGCNSSGGGAGLPWLFAVGLGAAFVVSRSRLARRRS
ncbi:MAG: CHRD domain-containing protein [Myxococcales bacterium]|nr:CHRD domain-containing protein [Myxococcales bacterium]MBL0196069.1 CHRD domain-containing protein [Myxococcales bacterium]